MRDSFRKLAVLLLFTGLASTVAAADAAQAGPWRQGVHYNQLSKPQPTSVASGKVEVSEVFWYGCSHCFALDPVLEHWHEKKAPYIEFVRVPVIWSPLHRQHAKLYYTMQALKKPDLHARIFEAIHKEGQPLADRDELKARAMAEAFFGKFGVTKQEFDAAYDSMMVAVNVQKAAKITHDFAVGNVPAIYINGKYSTGVSEAGGPSQLLSLIDHLAAGEKNR